MFYSKRLSLITALLILQACGGGGNSGDSFSSSSVVGASSNSAAASSTVVKSYSLQKINTTALGAIYTAPLTGIDSNAIKYTASVKLENKAQGVVNGVLVTPREHLLSYTPIGGSVVSTSNDIDYIDASTGNLVSALVDGVSCTSISPYSMPASIKLGDVGALFTLSCSNNDTQERVWQTEDAGNGNIRIIFNEVTKNSLNTTIKTKYYSYTLSANGDIPAFKVTESFPLKNFNIIFSSTLNSSSSISSASNSSASSSVRNATCDGRTYCSQMTSCAEATYFLQSCPGVEMDGNNDGVPCEKQWCN